MIDFLLFLHSKQYFSKEIFFYFPHFLNLFSANLSLKHRIDNKYVMEKYAKSKESKQKYRFLD